MIPLSKSTLEYAVNCCMEKDFFYAGIACASEQKQKEIIKNLHDIFQKKGCIYTCRSTLSELIYKFDGNNSRIQIFCHSKNGVGCRIHLMIVDECMTEEEMCKLFLPFEMEYIDIKNRGWDLHVK